ncbi:hypothetical protein [Nesterenkonia sp. HG001]|uniref:hypothetical protein n=1 Tax=Nesterenkonia sp. HG001 TaxID=2983207 RepID=UPI002AC508F3|nr:hypothetical protein [Nesterenkonia sp. HG001]MDZ5076446.1 hypothetical protein [Nesterenkonia sp. HG001]
MRLFRRRRHPVDHLDARLREDTPELLVVLLVHRVSRDEAVIQVVADEQSAQEVAATAEGDPAWSVEWQAVPVLDAHGGELVPGVTVHLVSDDGPADDAPQDVSPVPRAAFVSREEAEAFAEQERHADVGTGVPRILTLVIGASISPESGGIAHRPRDCRRRGSP